MAPKWTSSCSLLSLWFLVSVVLVGSQKGGWRRANVWGDSCPATPFFPPSSWSCSRCGRLQWQRLTKISTTKCYTSLSLSLSLALFRCASHSSSLPCGSRHITLALEPHNGQWVLMCYCIIVIILVPLCWAEHAFAYCCVLSSVYVSHLSSFRALLKWGGHSVLAIRCGTCVASPSAVWRPLSTAPHRVCCCSFTCT